jgi:hypothetical protein
MAIADVSSFFDVRTETLETKYTIKTPPNADQVSITKQTYQSKVRKGVRNPKHQAQIRRGTEATTDYNCFYRSYDYEPYTVTLNFKDVGVSPNVDRVWTYSGDPLFLGISRPDGALDATSDALARTKALERFMSRANQELTTFQGGVVIGEIRETIGLLRSPMAGIRGHLGSYVGKLRKLKRQAIRSRMTTRKMLELASEMWLEVAFGWRPLFADARDLCSTLEDLGKQSPDRVRLQGSGEAEKQVSVGQIAKGFAFSGNVIADIYETFNFRYKFYGAIDCTAMGGSSLARKFGLGPENFLPTVWEVIPYSFLVDYFTNIGQIISAFSMFRNRIKRCAYVRRTTQLRRLVGQRMVPPTPSGPTWQNARAQLSHGSGAWKMETYDRALHTGWNVPDFRWKIPTNINQYVNMAALLVLRKAVLPFKATGP